MKLTYILKTGLIAGLMSLNSNAVAGSKNPSFVPDRTLRDIAAATYDQYGNPLVVYNPDVVNRTDSGLVAFFREHEIGHHALDHLKREYFEAGPFSRAWVRQGYEKEADCYATEKLMQTNPTAVEKAITFFRQSRPGQTDWYHPPGYERAAHIEACKSNNPSRTGKITRDGIYIGSLSELFDEDQPAQKEENESLIRRSSPFGYDEGKEEPPKEKKPVQYSAPIYYYQNEQGEWVPLNDNPGIHDCSKHE